MSKKEIDRLWTELGRLSSGHRQACIMQVGEEYGSEAYEMYVRLRSGLNKRCDAVHAAYLTACERMARAKRRGRRVP